MEKIKISNSQIIDITKEEVSASVKSDIIKEITKKIF